MFRNLTNRPSLHVNEVEALLNLGDLSEQLGDLLGVILQLALGSVLVHLEQLVGALLVNGVHALEELHLLLFGDVLEEAGCFDMLEHFESHVVDEPREKL